MKKINIFVLLTVFLTLMVSCSSKIDLELNNDGTVNLSFDGETGKSLEKLIRTTQNVKSGKPVFNTSGIQSDLIADGFSDVKVTTPQLTELYVQAKDKKQKSMFFTSNLVSTKNNKLCVNLSPRTLVDFYENADPELALYLDMLLSPVFNGEDMSEAEYLELISAFYGPEVAAELKKAQIQLTLKNPDGKKSVHNISLVKLLTLNTSLQLE
ncbi:MAG: hypothetical protein MJ179_01400 [Treponema sp.]|nr:hypothetical protein [Treponema sp.]